MSNEINDYKKLTNEHMVRLFSNLFDLKEQKKLLDNQIKAIEAEYKPMIEKANQEELYYELPNKQRFNVKRTERKGGWNAKKLEQLFFETDVEEESYRNKPSVVFTLRVEKGEDNA